MEIPLIFALSVIAACIYLFRYPRHHQIVEIEGRKHLRAKYEFKWVYYDGCFGPDIEHMLNSDHYSVYIHVSEQIRGGRESEQNYRETIDLIHQGYRKKHDLPSEQDKIKVIYDPRNTKTNTPKQDELNKLLKTSTVNMTPEERNAVLDRIGELVK